MKKTLLIAAAAPISASAFAETVTSANIVGYVKTVITNDSFNMLSTAFINTSNTIEGLLGDVDGTVYFWDSDIQNYMSVTKGRGGWGDGGTNVIERGSGIFLLAAAGNDIEQTFSGDVPTDGTFTNYTAGLGGYALMSLPYTADIAFSNTALFASADASPTIYFWSGAGYESYSKGRGGWTVTAASRIIKAGEPFFYKTGAADTGKSITEVQPYTLD